jgi:uncharacterized protein (DUF433 family)
MTHDRLKQFQDYKTMIATPITEQIPIRADGHGRLRVGNTRVLLDLVIYSFRLGHTPETITAQYPSLSLDDIYLALGYYLRHRDEIDSYLRQQAAKAEAFHETYEREHPPRLTRAILLERLEAKRKASGE